MPFGRSKTLFLLHAISSFLHMCCCIAGDHRSSAFCNFGKCGFEVHAKPRVGCRRPKGRGIGGGFRLNKRFYVTAADPLRARLAARAPTRGAKSVRVFRNAGILYGAVQYCAAMDCGCTRAVPRCCPSMREGDVVADIMAPSDPISKSVNCQFRKSRANRMPLCYNCHI